MADFWGSGLVWGDVSRGLANVRGKWQRPPAGGHSPGSQEGKGRRQKRWPAGSHSWAVVREAALARGQEEGRGGSARLWSQLPSRVLPTCTPKKRHCFKNGKKSFLALCRAFCQSKLSVFCGSK